MKVDPKQACLYIPPGLKKFKLDLFTGIGRHIERAGGRVVHGDLAELDRTPEEGFVPIVGCTPTLRPLIERWRAAGLTWIYWDRGYLRRVFATWLPKASSRELSYYRWHVGEFQMLALRDVPDDRWRALDLEKEFTPWRKGGRKIVVCHTLPDYWNLRGLPEDWAEQTAVQLRQWTDRPIIVRHKESKLPLREELKDAHALVTHGSIAAIESVVMGCPVFVDPSCAAHLVGSTDLAQIEHPVYPDGRERWLHSLAYCQFNEHELVDGTLWRLME